MIMAEKKDPPYFMYFPGNYRWSAAFINMISSAPYGGSEIGELHKIGTLLKGKAPDDDEAWFDACVKVADGERDVAVPIANLVLLAAVMIEGQFKPRLIAVARQIHEQICCFSTNRHPTNHFESKRLVELGRAITIEDAVTGVD